MQLIDELILEALSFYEPMSKEKIILDIDVERAKQLPQFTLELLETRLQYLTKIGLLKKIKEGKETHYLRLFKSNEKVWQKIWRAIKLSFD